jgi:thiosulfate/3-mercaptopyruvate sulfurtransferase
MFFRQWLAGVGLAAAIALPAAAQQGPLVEAEWLAKNLENPKVRVFEVSVDPGVYERGHIPGAVNISWHSELVDPIRRDIVSAENFKKLVEKAGVAKDTTVVLYGDNNNWFAAWGVWVFNIYGIDAKLLDGGRKYWEAKGLPLDNKTPSHQASKIDLPAPKLALRARLADVNAAVQNKSVTLVDIRSPDEYSGKVIAPEGIKELSVRAGHIPGAKNVPWGRAVDPQTGKFLPKEQLAKVYADAGIDGKQPIITYCRIGERSSHTWFALAKILGYNNVRNYDGSWTEYGNAVGLPIVNVAGTVWQGK